MARRIFKQLAVLAFLVYLTPSVKAELAVIVHPDNPVDTLTQHQVRRIFLGRMPLYPNTGDQVLTLDLPANDPCFDAFYSTVVEMGGTKLKRYRAYYLFSGRGKLSKELTSHGDMLKTVATNKLAVGYVDSKYIDQSVKVLLTISHPLCK